MSIQIGRFLSLFTYTSIKVKYIRVIRTILPSMTATEVSVGKPLSTILAEVCEWFCRLSQSWGCPCRLSQTVIDIGHVYIYT